MTLHSLTDADAVNTLRGGRPGPVCPIYFRVHIGPLAVVADVHNAYQGGYKPTPVRSAGCRRCAGSGVAINAVGVLVCPCQVRKWDPPAFITCPGCRKQTLRVSWGVDAHGNRREDAVRCHCGFGEAVRR